MVRCFCRSLFLTECIRFSKAKCNKCITKPTWNVLKERFDKSKQNKIISTIHTSLEIKKDFYPNFVFFFLFYNEHKPISMIKKFAFLKNLIPFKIFSKFEVHVWIKISLGPVTNFLVRTKKLKMTKKILFFIVPSWQQSQS